MKIPQPRNSKFISARELVCIRPSSKERCGRSSTAIIVIVKRSSQRQLSYLYVYIPNYVSICIHTVVHNMWAYTPQPSQKKAPRCAIYFNSRITTQCPRIRISSPFRPQKIWSQHHRFPKSLDFICFTSETSETGQFLCALKRIPQESTSYIVEYLGKKSQSPTSQWFFPSPNRDRP